MIEKGNKKIIRGWSFYDWANSAYSLVITSTIFPIYYTSVTSTAYDDKVSFLGIELNNTVLYNFALAFAYLVVATVSPLLSGIADFSGKKKLFMKVFCYLGAISCGLMYFFDETNLWLGLTLVILASIGWSGSIVFYNAFLPEIVEPKDQDKVSAKGYSYGYIGSVLLLIFNLIMIQAPQLFFDLGQKATALMEADSFLTLEQALDKAKGYYAGVSSRISFLTVGIWWVVFSQFSFRILPNNVYNRKNTTHILTNGYKELISVWKVLRKTERLRQFLSAFFAYNMGVQTVMLVAVLFGTKELKLESGELILTILIIQLVAIFGAYLFSFSSSRIGNITTLQMATLIWIGVCIFAYFIPAKAPVPFYIMAFFVGLVMGGIQSLSRSTYSKMLPRTEDHASFFSFYDICDKIGLVLGMVIYGIVEQYSDNMRNSVVALLLFFVAGFFLLKRIPRMKLRT
jgi:UMF1 family MFS transporter